MLKLDQCDHSLNFGEKKATKKKKLIRWLENVGGAHTMSFIVEKAC